jgi:hypothetical protein
MPERQMVLRFDEARRADLRERAEKWVGENPEIYRLFVRFAEDLATLGKRFGIGLLAERVRWECAVSFPDKKWKVNNSYRAYLARRLMEEVPGCRTLIETRRVRC